MLKRTIILSILAVLLLAGSAFAAAGIVTDSTLPGFRPSKSVSTCFNSNSLTGSATIVVYQISTAHASGNTIYGTDSATTKMFRKDKPSTGMVDSDCNNLPTATTTSVLETGSGSYTAM